MNLDGFPYGNPDVEVLPGEQKYPFKLKEDFVYCFPGDNDFVAQDFVTPAGYQTAFFSIRVKIGCIYTWKTHKPVEVSEDLLLMLDATDRWYSAKSRHL